MKSGIALTLLGLVAALVVLAAPAAAQPGPGPYYPPPPPPPPPHHDVDNFGEFRVWVGSYWPTQSGSFWNNNYANFTGSKSDFQDVIAGGDFIWHFDRVNALMFSVSGYSGSQDSSYKFLADENNNPIGHHTSLDLDSGTVAYTLFPAGTHNAVIPYLGAGIGIYGWRLHQGGEFVDPSNNIYGAAYTASGTAFAYLFLAGLEVPVSRHVAILVDGRYTVAHANLGGDFAGFGRLDLSGAQVEGGVAFHL